MKNYAKGKIIVRNALVIAVLLVSTVTLGNDTCIIPIGKMMEDYKKAQANDVRWAILNSINPGAYDNFTTLKREYQRDGITPESYALKFSTPLNVARLHFLDALRIGIITSVDKVFYRIL